MQRQQGVPERRGVMFFILLSFFFSFLFLSLTSAISISREGETQRLLLHMHSLSHGRCVECVEDGFIFIKKEKKEKRKKERRKQKRKKDRLTGDQDASLREEKDDSVIRMRG